MVVKTQNQGRSVTGLHIGRRNVRRYFPKAVQSIDIDLDQLQIQCSLDPAFWDGDPNIEDARLCAWLEAKSLNANPRRGSLLLDMIPSGQNAYRLQFVR
jgi:hypothetical protein